ncbi:tyrosine-type recombinase/integrase [Methylomonas sp. MS20]|uniref:tyrosine-type recombinase/integrase n=1 Tax=unclassified Methylomonas TaxID=2608980 RepID=UPI0028A51D01|nr:tyrosine-type recombinase/integrase [Methylomonas sp. MV1]MDT4328741.1 tyrosine-type recombinase/integrase [Methylomonas sp. MV1]
MALNLNKDTVYRTAKPKDKEYFINDGGGLNLVVGKNGTKIWKFIFTFDGKRKKLSFGVYPDTTLEAARRKAEDARQSIANRVDPSEARKEIQAARRATKLNDERISAGLPIIDSFADITRQWLLSTAHLTSETTHTKKTSRIERLAFPILGDIPLKEVKSGDILAVLKPLIDKHQLETAHRLNAEIGSIFAYGIVHGFTDYDPSQPVAKQIPAQKVKHRAAIIEPKSVGQLLRDIYNYQGTFVVQSAFRLSPLLFQRPGEIRQMLWDDVDLESREWRPYISKTDFDHIVPLSRQAINLLEGIRPLTGSGKYVFPSSRGDGRPMSDNTIRTALKSLGYDSEVMTAHGFRTTASTLLNEQGWSPDAIERQLAHSPRDQVRAAYNRAQYLDERRRMMQAWADYLDALKNGAQVIQFPRQA